MPLGVIFKDKAQLWEQHQVLAVGYSDNGPGAATLSIWDNNDGDHGRTLSIDFVDDALSITGATALSADNRIAGIFHEAYDRRRPAANLRLP